MDTMKVLSFLKAIFFRRIIFNIFPVIIVNSLIFLFLKSNKDFNYVIILFSNFIPFINIGYLFAINYLYSIIKNKKYFFISFILMLVSSCMAHFLAYFNWGFSSGHFYDPDWGTVLVTKIAVSLNLLILIIGSVIIQVYLIHKHKKEK